MLELKNEFNINKNNINLLICYYRKHLLIVFGIKLLLILFIGYTLISFTQVYAGGFPDLLAGMVWTFIFLQINPFIYCFIFAFILKRETNEEESCLVKFGKIIYF